MSDARPHPFGVPAGSDPRPEDIPSFEWPKLSNYAVHLRSWETRNRIPGYNPAEHQYPKMLYKAERPKDADGNVTGPWRISDPYDEAVLRRCSQPVENEAQEQEFRAKGWCDPGEAMKRRDRDEDEIARVAAHRRFEDRGMSDLAKAEVLEAEEDAGIDHVPAKPEARLDKRSKAYKDAQKSKRAEFAAGA